MNLKQMVQRRRQERQDADLDLTAVMNIFLILIPFLLLTAVFVKVAVLELSLPNLDRSEARAQQAKKPKNMVLNFLFIREDELELKSPELKFSPIPMTTNGYNWSRLETLLQRIGEKYPASKDIIISPANSIQYETIIHAMDRCRENGFVNISISG